MSGAVRGSITGSGPVACASRRCARWIRAASSGVLAGTAAQILALLRVSRRMPSSRSCPHSATAPSLSPDRRTHLGPRAVRSPEHGCARFCASRAETVP